MTTECANLVNVITNSITALSALAVAILAVIGVNAWKKQMQGKRK